MGVYAYQVECSHPRVIPVTASPEAGVYQSRTQGREGEHAVALVGRSYIRTGDPTMDPESTVPVTRPDPTVPADWGTSFWTCLAGHIACNLSWAEWMSTVFVFGRRVPEGLGGGNVIVIPTGGRTGEYRLGVRRAIDGYPTFTILVRMGPRGDQYDLAMHRAEQVFNLLTASWTGVIPGKVPGHGDIGRRRPWSDAWSPAFGPFIEDAGL